ncbi:MAG TPA: PDZ domain-containing protein, partial [Candidatus Tumulicola sp.]
QPGDVILQIDGKTFDSRQALAGYVGAKKPGDTIRVNVWSQGVKKLVAIKLGETPAGKPMASQGQPQEQPQQP